MVFIVPKSLVIVLNHVVIGRPLTLLVGFLISAKAIFAGALSGSLCRCPNHVSRLLFTVVVQGSVLQIVYRVVLLVVFCTEQFSLENAVGRCLFF